MIHFFTDLIPMIVTGTFNVSASFIKNVSSRWRRLIEKHSQSMPDEEKKKFRLVSDSWDNGAWETAILQLHNKMQISARLGYLTERLQVFEQFSLS